MQRHVADDVRERVRGDRRGVARERGGRIDVVDDFRDLPAQRVDVEIERIEQQRAEPALRRAEIGAARKDEVLLAGDFRKTAVAALRSALRAERSVELRLVIRP
ncbi:MAG: hypothetical protein EPN19_12405, partial [Betaproteobacteria bacterium]